MIARVRLFLVVANRPERGSFSVAFRITPCLTRRLDALVGAELPAQDGRTGQEDR
jgi:hypothetical protein